MKEGFHCDVWNSSCYVFWENYSVISRFPFIGQAKIVTRDFYPETLAYDTFAIWTRVSDIISYETFHIAQNDIDILKSICKSSLKPSTKAKYCRWSLLMQGNRCTFQNSSNSHMSRRQMEMQIFLIALKQISPMH